MNFELIYEENKQIIDNALSYSIKYFSRYKEGIIRAMEYSLFTGGKRIRPILALETFKLFNNTKEDIDEIIPYAIAIEMIHTYSLIHDDLPAMDNDDTRRGKPTNHVKFGESMAILAGDALLNLAFEVISDHMNGMDPDINEYNKNIRAFQEVASYSGTSGMIGGQVVDLHLNEDNADEESILFMYKSKTAALIEAAAVSGAIIGNATRDEIHNIRNYAYNLGMAYQIRDDFLDLEEDRKINKITYISILGEERSMKDLEKYSIRANEELYKLKKKDIKFLLELTNRLIKRKI